MIKPTKLGLLNFWYYDEEEYEFFDGKMLLRGKNGSGKSVTMQSFIPLILDGNKTPKRLDTFGGSDKHIEYYLLGEDKDNSTGYLYMEFFDSKKEKYITIGIGLTAKRGKQTELFGFALKDGRRIHDGFELYKQKDGFNKTPLTKLELRASLGINNNFVESAKEYKKMVNNLLYGFKSSDSFDEFINIILQIRSPKLSKEYKPSILMKTLNDVLPPLSNDDLNPLVETIESMNTIKEKIDDLNSKIKDLNNFIKVYNNYNQVILYLKAKKYSDTKKEYNKLIENFNKLKEENNNLEDEKGILEKKIKELKEEYDKAIIEKENNNNKDIISKTKRLAELENEIKDLKNNLIIKKENLELSKNKINNLNKNNEGYENKIKLLNNEVKKIISNIEDYSKKIYFNTLENYLNLIISGNLESFEIINDLIINKKKDIDRIRNILKEKEEYNNKIEKSEVKFNKLIKEYNKIDELIKELNVKLDNEKDNFINILIENNRKHKEFILEDADLKEIINILADFNLDNYDLAKNKYDEIFQKYYQENTKKLSSLEVKLTDFNNELKDEENILSKLESEEEIELTDKELESETNLYLINNNINYISFYKAIEFKDDINKNIKNSLEANLLSSGLLNAKIILLEDIKKVSNTNITYLVPSNKKKNNLSKYFNPIKNIKYFSEDYILSILESISIDETDNSYINEKSYKFDVLHGYNNIYEAKYIGFLNRKNEHLKKISKQKNLINELKSKITSVENLKIILENNNYILNDERKDFPNIYNLKNIISDIEENNIKTKIILENKNEQEEELKKFNNELENLMLELNKIKGDNKIPLNLASFNEASTIIEIIEKDFYSIKNREYEINSLKELKQNNLDYLKDVSKTFDDYLNIIAEDNKLLTKKETEYQVIEKTLNTDEYKEISDKLKKLELIINNYPEKSSELERNLGKISENIIQKNANYQELHNQIEEMKIYLDLYFNILEEEFNLKYVINDFELNENNVDLLLNRISTINSLDKTRATANYYNGFNNYRQSLIDYSLNDIVLFDNKNLSIKLYLDKDIPEEKLINIFNEAERQDITAIYQGKKVNLYTLLSNLKDDYESNKILLSEKDRHLFEDILLRTIGSKIKDKINAAKDWVKNINDIMEEKGKDSNLRFYLSWLNKSKESLEEMDTKDLVEIFKMDPDLLNDEIINKLIKHFRAKIANAEEVMEENKQSYNDIIFNILDYRNWFEFKLYYKRLDGERRELTDKAFSVFSGGEKAKTMYIPLFASICAKLSSANEDAPRLIALDEAFAGVDDDNIEEMFAILSSFDLDYILTSQALWCDYSTVKDISICELISDHVSKTIGVKHYRWNGKVRISLDGDL